MTDTDPTTHTAAERVRAYLDEMDRVDQVRPQYDDTVHAINDLPLTRGDLRELLAAAGVLTTPTPAPAYYPDCEPGCEVRPDHLAKHREGCGTTPAPDTNQRERLAKYEGAEEALADDEREAIRAGRCGPLRHGGPCWLLPGHPGPHHGYREGVPEPASPDTALHERLAQRIEELLTVLDSDAVPLVDDPSDTESVPVYYVAVQDVLDALGLDDVGQDDPLDAVLADVQGRDQAPTPTDEQEAWECGHLTRCADAACSYNPAMQRWIDGSTTRAAVVDPQAGTP